MAKNNFLYMYPIKSYFDTEIARLAPFFENNKHLASEFHDLENCSDLEEKELIRKDAIEKTYSLANQLYFDVLNRSINLRYRSNNYSVYLLKFPDTEIDPRFDVAAGDTILDSDISFSSMVDDNVYADPVKVLAQMNCSGGSSL